MYIYIYIYVCVRVYTCIYVCVYIYTYTHTHIYLINIYIFLIEKIIQLPDLLVYWLLCSVKNKNYMWPKLQICDPLWFRFLSWMTHVLWIWKGMTSQEERVLEMCQSTILCEVLGENDSRGLVKDILICLKLYRVVFEGSGVRLRCVKYWLYHLLGMWPQKI